MMTDYQIQPITRRCAVSGRELKPGERFYTALVEECGQFVRHDYAVETWQGAPAGAFSFWSGKVPPPNDPAKPRFDDELLEDCFHRLEGQTEPGRINFRYVVALLLIRRKKLKFEQTTVVDGVEHMTLRWPRSGAVCQVVNPRLTEEEMTAVQEEVFRVLGWS